MKKFLLPTFYASIAFLFSTHAQQVPSFNYNWEFQPIRTETYLYNSDQFDFDVETENANDSIPLSLTDFNYEEAMVMMQTSEWLDGDWSPAVRTDVYLRNETETDSMVMSQYDAISTSWTPMYKVENVYNGNMHTQSRSYMANSVSNEWEVLTQTDYGYDGSGYLIDETVSVYSEDSAKLVTTSRTDYYYTESQKDSIKMYYMIDGGWQLYSQTEYMYNIDGQAEEEIYYYNDPIAGELAESTRTEYKYDDNGNQFWSARYDWDLSSEGWLMVGKDSTIYTADTNNPVVIITHEKPLTAETLYLQQKTFFSYGNATSINKTVLENQILVYPNPAIDYITVIIDGRSDNYVKLFDLNGRLLFDRKLVSKTTQIPVQHLTSGNYILRVQSQGGSHSRLIVVE